MAFRMFIDDCCMSNKCAKVTRRSTVSKIIAPKTPNAQPEYPLSLSRLQSPVGSVHASRTRLARIAAAVLHRTPLTALVSDAPCRASRKPASRGSSAGQDARRGERTSHVRNWLIFIKAHNAHPNQVSVQAGSGDKPPVGCSRR